jgi:hypothetical protein
MVGSDTDLGRAWVEMKSSSPPALPLETIPQKEAVRQLVVDFSGRGRMLTMSGSHGAGVSPENPNSHSR